MAGLPTTASVIARSTWYDFHTLWQIGAEPEGHPGERPEVTLSFHRPVMIPYTKDYAQRLVPAIGIVSTSRVLVVGGGFGFLAEALIDPVEQGGFGLSSDRVATCDPSTYITGSRNQTEEADINSLIVGVGIDLASNYGEALKGKLFDGGVRCRTRFAESRLENQSAANSVKGMFPSSTIDFVVTDDGYLNYHSDAEMTDIFTSIDRLGAAQVWHITYPDWGNAKTIAEFKAMKPEHRFINYWTAETA